eukprot:Clim_evm58s77 gene=Clim_evmTU58s77
MGQEQTVKLIASDGVEFDVPASVACKSVTIKNMLEDLGTEDEATPVPLPNVSGTILDKVIQYCKHHKDDVTPADEDDVRNKNDDTDPWDTEFCRVDQGTLFELILAANYLDIKPMLDLTCKTVAQMIKGKKAEEIRKTFNIKNDFTPEEEEEVKKENQWCEEN